MMALRMHEAPRPPPRWKMAVLTWLALYPTLLLLTPLVAGYVEPLPPPMRTLVVTALVVPLMSFLLVPTLVRVFAGWLRR